MEMKNTDDNGTVVASKFAPGLVAELDRIANDLAVNRSEVLRRALDYYAKAARIRHLRRASRRARGQEILE